MTKRILRLNELIKKELGQIILREIEFPSNVLATITRVETASNLSVARVFLSVFPESFFVQAAKILNSQIYFLQQELNEKLRMRPVPRIFFCEEKTTFSAGRVEELLEQTKTGSAVDPVKSGRIFSRKTEIKRSSKQYRVRSNGVEKKKKIR